MATTTLPTRTQSHANEPGPEDRGGADDAFRFGRNWANFLRVVGDERIEQATASLRTLLGSEELSGKRLIDVGCGSGLFSLAAVRLGARVHSFDYDRDSVACAAELRSRFAGPTAPWTIEQGSALDERYLDTLGQFDVVYSWGVLHHTGSMWRALGNMPRLVARGGDLAISIYNDQGSRSAVWRGIKRTYNRLPEPLRAPFAMTVMMPGEIRGRLTLAAKGRWREARRYWQDYGADAGRGMSRWHDILDWVGGYPFEVARPEEIFEFYRDRGFTLEYLRTAGGGVGCNEFRFRRADSPARS